MGSTWAEPPNSTWGLSHVARNSTLGGLSPTPTPPFIFLFSFPFSAFPLFHCSSFPIPLLSDVSPWPWPWPRPRLDSDTKLACICTQMEFVPLGYLFERILAAPASSAPVERVFSARQHIAYAIARYVIARPSVCPSHGWISKRRLKLGSRNLHHKVAHDSSFLTLNFTLKFQREDRERGAE